MIGVLLGLRFTALALMLAVLPLTTIAAGYGLATHQGSMVGVVGVLAAFVVPQLGFALAVFSKSRAIKPPVLVRAAQMAIGQEMAKLPLPQDIPANFISLLRRLDWEHPRPEIIGPKISR